MLRSIGYLLTNACAKLESDILESLEITAKSSGNYVIEKALLKSREAIREGLLIYQPLEDEWVFPPMVTRMFRW